MTYRDLNEALEARRTTLAEELAELDQKARALNDLRTRTRAARSELDRVTEALSQRRLPLLDRIQVASPCSEGWEDMSGNERRRFCGKCQKHVYNLSAMTSDEAEALVFETEGRICVRFYRRADGTVLTQDCPVGRQRKRRRWLAAVSLAAAGAGAAAAIGGQATTGELVPIEPAPAVMGSAAVPDDPAPSPEVAVEAAELEPGPSSP
jgi:hypothetical protein